MKWKWKGNYSFAAQVFRTGGGAVLFLLSCSGVINVFFSIFNYTTIFSCRLSQLIRLSQFVCWSIFSIKNSIFSFESLEYQSTGEGRVGPLIIETLTPVLEDFQLRQKDETKCILKLIFCSFEWYQSQVSTMKFFYLCNGLSQRLAAGTVGKRRKKYARYVKIKPIVRSVSEIRPIKVQKKVMKMMKMTKFSLFFAKMATLPGPMFLM